jgi:GWxTD domain-containing protein
MNRIIAIVLSAFAISILSHPAYPQSYIFDEAELFEGLSPGEKRNYYSLRYLLNDFQKRHYLELPTREEREAWIERFWFEFDPTPTTEVNERRLEHEHRVGVVKNIFVVGGEPGWDDRGEAYIRFGEPAFRAKTLAYATLAGKRLAGEVWYYVPLEMFISFQDFNVAGFYTFTRSHFGSASRWEQKIIQQLCGFPPVTPDDMDYFSEVDLAMEEESFIIDGFGKDQIYDAIKNFDRAMKEQGYFYSCDSEHLALSAQHDVSIFRGSGERLRIEIDFEIPAEEFQFGQEENSHGIDLEYRVLVRDEQQKPVTHTYELFHADPEDAEGLQGRKHIPGRITLELDPGLYRLGLEIIDLGSGRRWAQRRYLPVPPGREGLNLSDVQFASRITKSEDASPFSKSGLLVVPHPTRRYGPEQLVACFFEIYGLEMDDDGQTSYTIDYSVVPRGKKRWGPVLLDNPIDSHSSVNGAGEGSQQAFHLEVPTVEFSGGTYELTVRVTDNLTSRRFEASTHFTIIE